MGQQVKTNLLPLFCVVELGRKRDENLILIVVHIFSLVFIYLKTTGKGAKKRMCLGTTYAQKYDSESNLILSYKVVVIE